MRKGVFTRSLYTSAKATRGVGEKDVTKRAEQEAKKTGKLNPLVDPAGFGAIRLSLPRVEKRDDGRYELLVGTPMPVETRVDTTGSMGGNVDVAMKVMPDAFEAFSKVLDGYDLQVNTGIFGDVQDNFPLCRPQFEMDADKIVNQLTLMVPERDGGDTPEDPDLGIFGGAYLVRAYINRIGLKGYDFTVTDAPGRGIIAGDQITRVFGKDAFEKVAENEHPIERQGALQLDEVWNALLDRAHAFVLQVGDSQSTSRFWTNHIGENRLVMLPDTKYTPYVQAAIIGLTEGTLILSDIVDFLQEFNLDKGICNRIAEAVSGIPIGAQSQLLSFSRRPQKGDLFAGKPDVWKDENLWPETQTSTDDDKPADTEKSEAGKTAEEESEWI